MKYRVIIGIMLTLLFVGMLTLAFNVQSAKLEHSTIIVPDDHEKIQWAIGNASEGDTVFVRAGIYYENVVVNKRVSLIGENKFNTIIDGNYAGHVMKVTANNVSIANFTIRNSGSTYPEGCGIYVSSSNNNISHNVVTNTEVAVLLYGSSDNIVFGNIILNNSEGIGLLYSSKSHVCGNTVSNNTYIGIDLGHANDNLVYGNNISNTTPPPLTSPGDGIYLSHSSGNFFYDNHVFNNEKCGIFFTDSGNNTVCDNSISNNMDGIHLHGFSNNNTISGNIIFSNEYYGIYVYDASNNTVSGNDVFSHWLGVGICVSGSAGIPRSPSRNNTICDNNVLDNSVGIEFTHSSINNIVFDNIVSNNDQGIEFHDNSNCNRVFSNSIANNDKNLYFWDSSGNFIYHNNISRGHVYCSNSVNVWDDGYPSGGNYWVDYVDVDLYRGSFQNETGSDGIWDHPYTIDDGNLDKYPLVPFWMYERETCVRVGDWFSYHFNMTWLTNISNFTISIESYLLEVSRVNISVSDVRRIVKLTNVTLQQTYHLENGSQREATGFIDVETGKWANIPIHIPPLFEPFLLVATNLSPGDQIYSGHSPTIQETVVRSYANMTRITNHLSLVDPWQNETAQLYQGLECYWDQKTGILAEGFFYSMFSNEENGEFVNFSMWMKINDTNVWIQQNLPVPYEAQGSDTGWCWAASTAMVLRYYGKPVHVWDVGKARSSILNLRQIEYYIHEKYPGEFETKIGSYASISLKTRKDIEGNLSRGYPVLLHVDPPGIGTHLVVVTGFNSSGFFIHDPSGALLTVFESSAKYPYIHEFATWEELQPLICKAPFLDDVFLVVEGTPLPLDATLHLVNGEWGIRTTHNSDSEKGICIDYSGYYWYLGLYWRSIGGLTNYHPLVWDSKDTLTYRYEIFNHNDQEVRFDFHLQIKGEDEIIYYESVLDISAPAFDSRVPIELKIPLKDYLVEGQQYIVAAEISYHGSQETIDSITLPPIDYGVKSIMFMTECPVRMLVTDPDGFRVGFDPASNQTVNEIPNALYYYGNGLEPEIISIPNQKDGDYSVTVFGIEDGTYNLTCSTLDEAGFLFTENFINIPIEKDESKTYIIPEFQSFLILPLFMITTLLAVIVYRRKYSM